MEVTSAEPDSAVSQAQGQAHRLCGSPRPPDPVSPSGPAVEGGKIRAWSSPAPLTEPEGTNLHLNPRLLWESHMLENLAEESRHQ